MTQTCERVNSSLRQWWWWWWFERKVWAPQSCCSLSDWRPWRRRACSIESSSSDGSRSRADHCCRSEVVTNSFFSSCLFVNKINDPFDPYSLNCTNVHRRFWRILPIKSPQLHTPSLLSVWPSEKNCMAKFGQIVAKYDPNLAKFGHTGLSGPWNSPSIQDPSNSIKSNFLYTYFQTINNGRSYQQGNKEWLVA